MDARCDVCLQPAAKKCTGCGKVFCDLHIRYGGQTGGMYGGGNVGYYCDECWETQVQRRRNVARVLVAVGVLLLALNLLGLLLFRGSFSMPIAVGPVAVAIVILGLLVVVGVVAIKNRP